jgi:hypothetical protein
MVQRVDAKTDTFDDVDGLLMVMVMVMVMVIIRVPWTDVWKG